MRRVVADEIALGDRRNATLRGEQHLVEVGELQLDARRAPTCPSSASASSAASSSAVGAAQIVELDHVAAGAAFTSSLVRPVFTERG